MRCDAVDEQLPAACRRQAVVVIGYGSPIRGDDAVGPLVADRLDQRVDDPCVTVISRHVLTAELAESLRDATLVIFIDASVDGNQGEVAVRSLVPRTDAASAMAHTLDAEALLGWTRGLYGKQPEAILVSIAGGSFDYANYHLSAAVEAAVEPMVQQTLMRIEQHLGRVPIRGCSGQ